MRKEEPTSEETANTQQESQIKTPKEKVPEYTMEDLLEKEDIGLDFPKHGEIRKGIIVSKSNSEILVSVGAKSEGIINGKELESIDQETRKTFKVGQEIDVFILHPENQGGNIVLSFTRALEESDWDLATSLADSNDVYESNIVGYNKGGLIVHLGKLRGFVPVSQLSVPRRLSASGDTPEQRWSGMVDDPIITRVIEVDRDRRRLILSERAAAAESREALKDRLLDELEEGMVCRGRVTSLADFGAFINIQGADGLVHLSEISWDRIKHPSEVLKVGQEVDVKVISLDLEKKRIGLSIRQLESDPWLERITQYRTGLLVEGKITRLVKFGAFAQLEENIEGLIHISELSDQRIAHPKEVLNEGDVVTLRIIKIDEERRRIGLSLRKVDSAAYADLDWKYAVAEEVEALDDDLEQDDDQAEEQLVPTDEIQQIDANGDEALDDDLEQDDDQAEEKVVSTDEIQQIDSDGDEALNDDLELDDDQQEEQLVTTDEIQ